MITFVVVKDGMLSSLKAFVISYSSNNVGIPCIFHCFLSSLLFFLFCVSFYYMNNGQYVLSLRSQAQMYNAAMRARARLMSCYVN